MNHQERLGESEAAIEAQIMREVFQCDSDLVGYSPELGQWFDFASRQVDAIKHAAAILDDESLIGLHSDAHNLAMQPDEADFVVERRKAAFALLNTALVALPYLDTGRTQRLYGRVLEAEKVEQEALDFLPLGLKHLTTAVGDMAVELWQRAVDHPDTTGDAIDAIDVVLERPDELPLLTEIGVSALQAM
jgi:hypothetical protein